MALLCRSHDTEVMVSARWEPSSRGRDTDSPWGTFYNPWLTEKQYLNYDYNEHDLVEVHSMNRDCNL